MTQFNVEGVTRILGERGYDERNRVACAQAILGTNADSETSRAEVGVFVQVAEKCEGVAKKNGIILDGLGGKKDKAGERDDENRSFYQIDQDGASSRFTLEQSTMVTSSSHLSSLPDAMEIEDESCPPFLLQPHQSSRTIAAQNKQVKPSRSLNPSQEMDQKIDRAFQMYHDNQLVSLATIAHQTGVSKRTIESYIPVIKDCLKERLNGAFLSDQEIVTICRLHNVYVDPSRIQRLLVEARKHKDIYVPSEKTSSQTSRHASSSGEATLFIVPTTPALTQPKSSVSDPADSNDLTNWDEINLEEIFDDGFRVPDRSELDRLEEKPLDSPICPPTTSEETTLSSWPQEGIFIPREVVGSKSDEEVGRISKNKKRKQSEIQSSETSSSNSKNPQQKSKNGRLDGARAMDKKEKRVAKKVGNIHQRYAKALELIYSNSNLSFKEVATRTGCNRGNVSRCATAIKRCLELERELGGAPLTDDQIKEVYPGNTLSVKTIKNLLGQARTFNNKSVHASSSSEAAPFILPSTPSLTQPKPSQSSSKDARGEVVGSKSDEKGDRVSKTLKRKQPEMQSSEEFSSKSKKNQEKSIELRLDHAFAMWHEEAEKAVCTIVKEAGISFPTFSKYRDIIAQCLLEEKTSGREELSEDEIKSICAKKKGVNLNVIKKWLPKARQGKNKEQYLKGLAEKEERVAKKVAEKDLPDMEQRYDNAFELIHSDSKLSLTDIATQTYCDRAELSRYKGIIGSCLTLEQGLLLGERLTDDQIKKECTKPNRNISVKRVKRLLDKARTLEDKSVYFKSNTRKS